MDRPKLKAIYYLFIVQCCFMTMARGQFKFAPKILKVYGTPALLKPSVTSKLATVGMVQELLTVMLNPRLLSPTVANRLLSIGLNDRLLHVRLQPSALSPVVSNSGVL